MSIKKIVTLIVLIIPIFSNCGEGPGTMDLYVITQEEQLKPGKTAGTYAYHLEGEVKWSQEEVFPIYLQINIVESDKTYKEYRLENKHFSINVDIPPGKYIVISEMEGKNKEIYHNAIGKLITIGEDGKADDGVGLGLEHKKKIQAIYPKNEEIIMETNPTFKWKEITGAKNYRVIIVDNSLNTRGETMKYITKKNFLKMGSELELKSRLSWTVTAFDNSDESIAYDVNYFSIKKGK